MPFPEGVEFSRTSLLAAGLLKELSNELCSEVTAEAGDNQ